MISRSPVVGLAGILAGIFTELIVTCVLVSGLVQAQESERRTSFERSVAPLLTARCSACHKPGEKKGGLDLTSREALLAGGDSGQAVVPGNLAESLLWQRVISREMPPKEPLSEQEQAIVRDWIRGGAVWSGGSLDPFRYTTAHRAGYDWWSLQPARGEIPAGWARYPALSKINNGIDLFIVDKLHAAGLHPSPPADRRTLIRRLSFDLLGLPPTAEETTAFETDASPLAYERLVDRWLATPAYGERWARHWLDLARFGESQGFERDKLRPNAWRYRDWVIDAWNDDLPYDEFARLQLAGDILRPRDPVGLVATGFLVAGPYDEVGQKQQSAAMRAVVREDDLEDMVSAVGQTFLGLTVNCSRCHDHKFDPITQTEYYRLAATLAGAHHGEPTLPGVRDSSREQALFASFAARIDDLQKRLAAEPAAASLATPSSPSSRAHFQFELNQLQEHQARIKAANVYAVAPKKPGATFVLLRGNPNQPGAAVTPGGIAAVSAVATEFGLSDDSSEADRRRHLAEWITSPQNPLFARVIVNRLWQFHFGTGLVETPNDFGFNGGRPSHPELLDWLAAELVRSQWSLKYLQRLLVTSATYRQSSQNRPDARSIDAGNRLLWRKEPARLDAESLRDTLLALSGELNPSMHGPGFYDFRTHTDNSQFYAMLDPVGWTFQRRSIYRTWVRSGRSPFLDVFDCPDPSTKTPQRTATTTPLQALSLLNNSFVLRAAEQLAERVHREAGPDPASQVRALWLLSFGRSPDSEEQAASETLARHHGTAALCRVLFNSNELLYIE